MVKGHRQDIITPPTQSHLPNHPTTPQPKTNLTLNLPINIVTFDFNFTLFVQSRSLKYYHNKELKFNYSLDLV